MESLGDILRRITARHKTGVAVAEPEEPSEPACPRCHGTGWLSTGLQQVDKELVANAVPCSCQVLSVPMGPDFASFNFDPAYPDLEVAYYAALHWSQSSAAPILIFGGEPGRGKTHLARAAYKACVANGDHCYWVKDGDLVDTIHQAFGDHTVDHLMRLIGTVPVLIIDELGLGSKGDTVGSFFDRILDKRWEGARDSGLRTLLTTNLSPQDFPARMASRLLDKRLSKAVVIDAPDYRQISVAQE